MDYTTEAILEGISMSNNDVMNYVYKKFFPVVRNFVETNNGNEEDARDLFQEAIIVVYRKIKKEPLVLNCNFKTYIFSVCRLLWLKQLEKKKISNEISSETILDNRLDEVTPVYEKSERYRLYQKHFKLLGTDCQKILTLSNGKASMQEIAEVMGYKGEKYAKKRKAQCKQYLMTSIKSDNEYKNAYDE